MLTLYGSIFGKGWSWKWQVDVTDFAPFLRDSVEVEYNHTGYEDKKKWAGAYYWFWNSFRTSGSSADGDCAALE